ncbi:MAG: TonB-dependent receptor [Flavobacteriaceae bacterium]|jgi:iron complex outermembrane receptor protein|nr:TonB-dependent receptor [Flavobacteriaceae bacterium]
MFRKLLPCLFLLIFCSVFGQKSTVIELKEVVISDNLLKDYSQTQKTEKLNDSVIKRNPSFLTSVLNYNSLIYFKENGLGGASSPSFRGTTAQQTAVIWNGININSQLLGQTDFNAVNVLSFNTINVKSGGGSVLYGSSAIGGSIHLNNDLYFYDRFENELLLRYGSFNTFDGRFQTKIASDKYSLQLGFARSFSDNDYDWVGKNQKNLNGEFENSTFNADFGYKLNEKNILKFYSQYFDGERHFSLILPTETPTKYHNTDIRNLLEWTSFFDKFTSRVKLAHLYEEYNYFPNINSEYHTFGKVESLIAKYDLAYDFSDRIKLNTILDFTQNKGQGSDIQNEKRQIGSGSLMFKHLLSDKFLYEIALRKEITNNYKSPLLYSLGMKYDFTDFYSVKFNTSKNFRIPTFNDLYWVTGGNPDLNPETSYQAEITNEFKIRDLSFSLTGYYNHIEDMLRWIPSGSMWQPENTDEVEIFGFEGGLSYLKNFGKHSVNAKANYGYTSSKNKKTENYLIYIPKHKANAGISYGYENLNVYGEYLYVGEVFTKSDNNSRYNIDAYQVVNLGTDYTFKKNYTIGIKVQNIFNTFYESVENRPLAGRNVMGYLILSQPLQRRGG